MNRFLSALLFAVLLITFSGLPQTAKAQNLAQADTIRFTLPEDSQFLPGEAGIPDQLKTLLDSVDIEQRSFDRLLVVGTYDEMGWKPSACNVSGNIPLEKENYEARQNQCDVEVAKWRAIQSAQYMIEQRWVNAWKVQPRLLLDERERGIVLVFVDDRTEERITALENRMKKLDRGNLDQVEGRISKLKRWFNNLEQRVTQNDSAIADVEDKNNQQDEDISEIRATANEALQTAKETKGQNGSSFSAITAGYRNELGLHMGKIGFETGNPVSLRFALGASSKGIATKLCNDSTDVSRAVYAEIGGRYTFRPIKWLSLGVGLSTTGTLLSLEEAKGLLALSVGPDVEARVNLTENLSLHGGVGYNYRHYLQNKLALSRNASSTSAELTVGFTFSF